MKTVEVKVYSYDELSPGAKQEARNWWQRVSEFDAEPTIEDAKTCLALCGVDISKVFWSGFGSQGDGASFAGTWTARNVQLGKLKEHAPQDEELHRIAAEFERLALLAPCASYCVKSIGRYSNEMHTQFDFSVVDECGDEMETTDAIEAALVDISRAAMRWIYRQLEKDYDYHNEIETIADNIRANEYNFTADGQRFHIV